MKNLFYLLILAAVTGCSPSGSQLSWRQETFGHSTFTADSDYVEVSYPVAAEGEAPIRSIGKSPTELKPVSA